MQAKTLYETTRSAFGALCVVYSEYMRSANQHAKIITCPDGSQFIQYNKGGCAWRDDKGYIVARRTALICSPTLEKALEKVRKAGVKAPTETVLSWIRSVGVAAILKASLKDIRFVASAF